jgi:glutathione S-transferase
MLTVWGRNNSINVMKVLWVCDEIGIAYRRIDAGLQHGVVDTPEYRQMNPNGRIPTIDDDGFVLWESNAIVRYLAARHERDDLLPGDPGERADIERWMDWATASLTVGMTPLFWQLIRTPPDQRDARVLAQATLDAERCMRLLDQHLASRDHLSAGRFTVADIPAAAFVQRWCSLPMTRPSLPALEAYRQRMLLREPFRANVVQALS